MIDFSQSQYWHTATGLPKTVYAGQTLAIVDESQSFIVENFLTGFGQQNFGLHVGDNAQLVQNNRMQLLQRLEPFGVKRLQWLNQTHSTTAYPVNDLVNVALLDGDGLVTKQAGVALMMMTADCLPIVVSNAHGDEVACLHAGWRGLANGIIERTIAKMQSPATTAWIGAAISQKHFEVGVDVRDTFIRLNSGYAEDFLDQGHEKYLGNLYSIATKKLKALGVHSVTGADQCSFSEEGRFYSYRRHAKTGRMATFIFITTKDDKLS